VTSGRWLAVAAVLSMGSAVAGHVGAVGWTCALAAGAVAAVGVWRWAGR
jgi:hypothetical protein